MLLCSGDKIVHLHNILRNNVWLRRTKEIKETNFYVEDPHVNYGRIHESRREKYLYSIVYFQGIGII